MISEILSQCEDAGINLEIENGRIHFTGPPGGMTETLKKEIAAHKPELLEYLYMSYFDGRLQAAITELNEAKVNMNDLPVDIQRKTLRLESEITAKMNNREVEDFNRLVDEWKGLFLEAIRKKG